MVVFTCELCFATLKKQQIDKHCASKCRNAWAFTCIECHKTFEGFDYRDHTCSMTEVEKYQGQFLAKRRVEKEKAKQEKAEKPKTDQEEVKEKDNRKVKEVGEKRSRKECDDAKEDSKMDKPHNIGAILFFLPGYGVTMKNIEEALAAAKERALYLNKLKQKKGC